MQLTKNNKKICKFQKEVVFIFTESYEHNKSLLVGLLRSDECFDVIERNIILSKKKAVIFYVNGLVKDDIMEKLMELIDRMVTTVPVYRLRCRNDVSAAEMAIAFFEL